MKLSLRFLMNIMESIIMNHTITLPPSKIWQENEKLFEEDVFFPLTHQVDHYNAFIREHKNLVINSSQTGGGKTIGSLYPLIHLDRNTSIRGNKMKISMLISPLNTLIMQTTNDVVRFIEQYKLNYMVFPITRITLNELQKETNNKKRQELLFQLFEGNVNYINPMVKVLNKRLVEDGHDSFRIDKPRRILFVMNPDILYGIVFDAFYPKSANIKQSIFLNLEYLIFDEFHYYSYIQLVQFFTLLSTLKVMKKFEKQNPVLISLLSATPNEMVIDTLDKIGIRYSVIHDGESNGQNIPIEFLAKNTLHFITSKEKNSRFLNIIDYDFIKEKFDNHEYTFIVSNSVNNANIIARKLTEIYGKENVGRVTGPIKDKNRIKESQKRIVVTTSTVDIGFNFKRDPSPERQEIENSIVEFFTYDEFVQRIGRVGRILGKSVTDYPCNTIVLVTTDEMKKIKKLPIHSSMTRKEIIDLFIPIFRKKDFYKKFFDMYGKSLVWSYIEKIKYNANDDNINEKLNSIYEIMSSIFPNDYYNQENKVKQLHKYSWMGKSDFDKMRPKNMNSLIMSFLFDTRFRIMDKKYKNGLDIGIELLHDMKIMNDEDYEYDSYRDILFNTVCKNSILLKKLISKTRSFQDSKGNQFIRHYYNFIKVLTTSYRGQFRGSSFQSHPLVIDRNGEYMGEPEAFRYNYFHILLYYDYEVAYFTDRRGRKQEYLHLTNHLEKTRNYDLKDYCDISFNQFKNNRLYYIPENTLNHNFDTHHLFANDQLIKEFDNILKEPHIAYFIPKKFYWTHTYGKLQKFHYTITFLDGVKKKYCVFFDTEALIAHSISQEKIENVQIPQSK